MEQFNPAETDMSQVVGTPVVGTSSAGIIRGEKWSLCNLCAGNGV